MPWKVAPSAEIYLRVHNTVSNIEFKSAYLRNKRTFKQTNGFAMPFNYSFIIYLDELQRPTKADWLGALQHLLIMTTK
jgi:hypothetical protein